MSFLSVAIEEHEDKTILETEYSYFLRLTEEQLKAVMEKFGDNQKQTFSESKLPHDPEGPYKGRIRHYPTDDGDMYILTTKCKGEERLSKIEENKEVDEGTYKMLKYLTKATYIRTRIYIPLVKSDGEPLTKKDGTPLAWEFDAYVDGAQAAQGKVATHEWIKIELEVDKAELEDVIAYIPFEYEELIASDTKDTTGRALLADLYDHGYNVHDKISLAHVTGGMDYE